MTHFDVQSNFDQSHTIVAGFTGNNRLAFNQSTGRFVALADRESESADYVTDIADVSKLVMEYLDVNPDFVNSKQIINALRGRSSPPLAGRIKRLVKRDVYESDALETLASCIQERYDERLKKGIVLEERKTAHLLEATPGKSEPIGKRVFRLQCSEIERGVQPGMKLIVENDQLRAVEIEDGRSTPKTRIIETFTKLLERNAQHGDVIQRFEDSLSEASSELASSLRSSITSPPLLSGSPVGSKERLVFETYATERQCYEIALGLKTGNYLAYNTNYQNFVSHTGASAQLEGVLFDKEDVYPRLYDYLQTVPRAQLTSLRRMLRENHNEESNRLARNINEMLLEQIPGELIKKPFDQIQNEVSKWLQGGHQLVYNTMSDTFIAIPADSVHLLSHLPDLDIEEEDVLANLVWELQESDDPNATALAREVQTKIDEKYSK
ncbi:MAG: hypothetical protein S4CHLAM81_10940 [Chlamydiales bacterium]|nr:hypothetical protein [Chlamydiales bacterium]MCH9635872.1 hypothetical protein [Chlamydiales bacterium]